MSHGVLSPEQTVTDSQQSPEAARSCTCPICEFDAGTQTDVYVHLQTSHRKSRLATALLEDANP